MTSAQPPPSGRKVYPLVVSREFILSEAEGNHERAFCEANMENPIVAVLIDVGGTLWPERPPSSGADDAHRLARLHQAVPRLTGGEAIHLIQELQKLTSKIETSLIQDSDALILEAAEQIGLPVEGILLPDIRKALCIPALGHLELFDGARELLNSVKALGLLCAVVSNAIWRDGDDYRRDFELSL